MGTSNEKKPKRKAYLISVFVGWGLAYLIFVAWSFLYYPYSAHTFIVLPLIMGLFYIIPALLNLMFFKIKEGKKYFLYLPIIITVVIFSGFGFLMFFLHNISRPDMYDDDQFYKIPLSIAISQIIMGIVAKLIIERQLESKPRT
jgi:hypothetical protein